MTKQLTQAELNDDMTTIGIGRYRNKIESAKARGSEAETSYGQRLIRGSLPAYIKAINDVKVQWRRQKNKANWQRDLLEMPTEKIGFIVMRTVLDQLTRNIKMAALSTKVGSVLDYQRRCELLTKTNKKGEGIILGAQRRRGWQATKAHIRKSMKHEVDKGLMEEIPPWTRRDLVSSGFNLVELLREITGVIEYRYVTDMGRRNPSRYVTASKATLDWMEEFNHHRELITPFWLPAVDTPVEWKHIWDCLLYTSPSPRDS